MNETLNLDSATSANASAQNDAGAPTRQLGVGEVETALQDVIDPELGVNVVDLGLVYDIKVDENNYVTIDMTLTTPACPLNDILEEDVATVLKALPITGHRVQWVWQPLWSPEMITEDGRAQLQMIGFNI
jgi:metal-sulfur cluster biosynthetic enzyme